MERQRRLITNFNWVTRLRYQLAGGCFFSIALPFLYWSVRSGWENIITNPVFVNSFVGLFFMIVLGLLAYRRFSSFADLGSHSYVLWSFAGSLLVVILVFVLLRLSYSRETLVYGSTAMFVWFVGIHLIKRLYVQPLVALIPGGDVENLSSNQGAAVRLLLEPETKLKTREILVADLRTNFERQWEEYIADSTLRGVPVYHYKQISEQLTGRVSIEHLSENTFGSLLPNLLYLRIKLLLDRILVLLLLPVLIPVMFLTSVIIYLNDGNPVFFKQKRMGYRGVIFTAYKFRTMSIDSKVSDDEGERVQLAMTREDDDRITSVGLFLRRTRLDELPQIINILKGEMSWIGPRPEALPLSKMYEKELSFYKYRHAVRPGISGWAQVSQGHVSSVDEVREKLQYDFYYIKNVSAWLDILIAIKTVRTVIFGFGAR